MIAAESWPRWVVWIDLEGRKSDACKLRGRLEDERTDPGVHGIRAPVLDPILCGRFLRFSCILTKSPSALLALPRESVFSRRLADMADVFSS